MVSSPGGRTGLDGCLASTLHIAKDLGAQRAASLPPSSSSSASSCPGSRMDKPRSTITLTLVFPFLLFLIPVLLRHGMVEASPTTEEWHRHALPYPSLSAMPGLLVQSDGSRMDGAHIFRTTADVDRSQTGNWSHLFSSLITSRLPRAGDPAFTQRPGGKRYFDKLVCIGMMKSGTTTIGASMRLLGLRHSGRWTKPFTDRSPELDEYYQRPSSWPPMYPAIRKRLEAADGFEDFPWPFLYRTVRDLVSPKLRVGFVLTIRPCRKHAESAAAYNNRRQSNKNTPEWVAESCGRTYRRCHLHQLDVYNYFKNEHQGPIDNLLVIEMSSQFSAKGWRSLVDFVYGGSQAVYGREQSEYQRPLAASKLLAERKELPHTNAHPSWQNKVKFCRTEDFPDVPIDGGLLSNMPPISMSSWCALPGNGKTTRCRLKYAALKKFYNGSIPKGLVPKGYHP